MMLVVIVAAAIGFLMAGFTGAAVGVLVGVLVAIAVPIALIAGSAASDAPPATPSPPRIEWRHLDWGRVIRPTLYVLLVIEGLGYLGAEVPLSRDHFVGGLGLAMVVLLFFFPGWLQYQRERQTGEAEERNRREREPQREAQRYE
jgi:hypothetical protein